MGPVEFVVAAYGLAFVPRGERQLRGHPRPAIRLTGVRVALLDAIRRSACTRPRRWLLALTLLGGLSAAVAVTAALPPADRTFATIANPVQSLISVAVPLVGILLVGDMRRTPRAGDLVPTLLAATVVAAAIGVAGAGFCAAALAVVAAQNLLSGRMTALMWLQSFAVVLLWGVGLNAAGAARLSH